TDKLLHDFVEAEYDEFFVWADFFAFARNEVAIDKLEQSGAAKGTRFASDLFRTEVVQPVALDFVSFCALGSGSHDNAPFTNCCDFPVAAVGHSSYSPSAACKIAASALPARSSMTVRCSPGDGRNAPICCRCRANDLVGRNKITPPMLGALSPSQLQMTDRHA